jgi:hypothetical protein
MVELPKKCPVCGEKTESGILRARAPRESESGMDYGEDYKPRRC